MDKQKCFDKLDELAEYENGWGGCLGGTAFSKMLLERCYRLVEQMETEPEIRPTVENCIAMDFDTSEIGIEISVSDNAVKGFVSDVDDNYSCFAFDDEESAVIFWNTMTKLFGKS